MNRIERYKAFRSWGYAASVAWQRSADEGARPRTKQYGMWNRAHDSRGEKVRWVENDINAGLRVVGYADDVNKYMSHKGWFIDDDIQDEVMRGIVYRLPARKGKSVFLYGYEDPHNPGCALVSMSIERGSNEAARYADSMAERHAEAERDYQRDWRKVANASERVDTARTEAREALQLVRDLEACDSPRIRKSILDDWCLSWAHYREAMTALSEALDNSSRITLAEV